MRALKGVGLAFIAVMITGCDFSPEGILGEDPVVEDTISSTAVPHSSDCHAPSPIWLVASPDVVPSFCDRMMNAFPVIEVVGQDGTLRVTVRKLEHGTFPAMGALGYQHQEGYPTFTFKCSDDTVGTDRKSYLCKPDWQHAVSTVQQNSDQIPVDVFVLTLVNEACGNRVGFQLVSGDYMCPTGIHELSPSPCLDGGSLGACADGPAPRLWISLQ